MAIKLKSRGVDKSRVIPPPVPVAHQNGSGSRSQLVYHPSVIGFVMQILRHRLQTRRRRLTGDAAGLWKAGRCIRAGGVFMRRGSLGTLRSSLVLAGGHMSRSELYLRGVAASVLMLAALPAGPHSFRVQCPPSTATHPSTLHDNNSEPAYTGPTALSAPSAATYQAPTANVNGAIKCQQIAGGDGYATMGDDTQTYLFSFGPLSGIADITQGKPGTQFPSVFNSPFPVSTSNYMVPGDPATSVDTPATTSGGFVQPLTLAQLSGIAGFYNGAIGLDYNVANTFNIADISETGNTVTVVLNAQSPFVVGDQVVIGQGPLGTDLNGYVGTFAVTAVNIANPFFPPNFAFQYTNPTTGLAEVSTSPDATASSAPAIDGHVDARQIMDVGVMNGNIPAPLMAIDEDDEFFLTLTNVGMIMRPDLFEQHTVHFHGYPNASAFYDGVPDASVAINIGASFTYYYLAPDAGTYFWHCHITPPEHLQMGMVGQLYVRPRQNREA